MVFNDCATQVVSNGGQRAQLRKISSLLSPLVLTADLLFLLGSEVILDVEGLSDFLGALPLDHVRNGLASNIEKGLDVKVVGGLHRIRVNSVPQ